MEQKDLAELFPEYILKDVINIIFEFYKDEYLWIVEQKSNNYIIGLYNYLPIDSGVEYIRKRVRLNFIDTQCNSIIHWKRQYIIYKDIENQISYVLVKYSKLLHWAFDWGEVCQCDKNYKFILYLPRNNKLSQLIIVLIPMLQITNHTINQCHLPI